MPKILEFNQRPLSKDIDLSYVVDDGLVVGVIDNISGTKLSLSNDSVIVTAGKSKTMTRRQFHTLAYSFMLLSGWDENKRATI